MPKRYFIPFALILILVLAACSGGQTAEVSQAEAVQVREEPAEMDQESMAGESMEDDAMSDMDDNLDGEADAMAKMEDEESDLDGAGHEEEGMAEESMEDDAMSDMNDSHDDDADAMAKMEDEEGDMDGTGHEDEGMAEEMEAEGDDSMEAMDSTEQEMAGESMEESMPAGDLSTWQTIALTNAATGEAFTLADFQGKTVFVEPMATWCTNCRKQQGQVKLARAQLNDDVVFVGLSRETTLPPGDLASYAASNGFNWTYAVMSDQLLQELAAEFGRSITSAPSTPHFLIRPDGTFTGLSTGIHSADQIIAEIESERG